MKKITWTTERRKVRSLTPASYNPRTISDKERADLADSIREYGEAEPVVINRDGRLIGGHQRVSIHLDMGTEEMDVRVPSRQLTLEEEMRLNLRLNRNTGQWDFKKLAEFDSELLGDVGFTEDELRVGIGGAGADAVEFDESRLDVITVQPPETPNLKDRVQLTCSTIGEFREVKRFFDEFGQERLLGAIRGEMKR